MDDRMDVRKVHFFAGFNKTHCYKNTHDFWGHSFEVRSYGWSTLESVLLPIASSSQTPALFVTPFSLFRPCVVLKYTA